MHVVDGKFFQDLKINAQICDFIYFTDVTANFIHQPNQNGASRIYWYTSSYAITPHYCLKETMQIWSKCNTNQIYHIIILQAYLPAKLKFSTWVPNLLPFFSVGIFSKWWPKFKLLEISYSWVCSSRFNANGQGSKLKSISFWPQNLFFCEGFFYAVLLPLFHMMNYTKNMDFLTKKIFSIIPLLIEPVLPCYT